jgi:hypothetical protein
MPQNLVQPQPALTSLALDALVTQLERCESDSIRLLGPTYIKRLQQWRRYRDDPVKLAAFIRDCLHRSSVNGWALHQKGGLSLESIVVAFGPPLFSKQDVDHARETLGLVAVAAVVARR